MTGQVYKTLYTILLHKHLIKSDWRTFKDFPNHKDQAHSKDFTGLENETKNSRTVKDFQRPARNLLLALLYLTTSVWNKAMSKLTH